MAKINVARLRGILAKMWWRMRELIYEEKPKPAPRKREGAASKKKENLAIESFSEGDETYLVRPATHLVFLHLPLCVYHVLLLTSLREG